MSGLLPKAQVEFRKAQQVHPVPSTDSGLGAQTSSGELNGGPAQRRLTQWTIISEKAGVQVTKERLKSFWTTLGVVSALMAALTYPAVSTPLVTKYNAGSGMGNVDDPIFVAYVLLNTSSLILSFMVVIISVVLLAEVDLVVTDEDLEAFIGRYQYLFLGLTGLFGVSILSIVASIIVVGFFNYNRATAIASAVICITGTVVVGIIAVWLATWTRSRLKVHIAEANALMRAAISRMRKVLQHGQGQGQGQGQGSKKGSGAFFSSSSSTNPAVAVSGGAAMTGGGGACAEAVEGNPRRTPSL